MLAGWSGTDITPAPGLHLCGFAARTGPSEAVRDTLEAHAIVLEYDGVRAALLVADVLGFDPSSVQRIRNRAAAVLKTAPYFVLLSATHTHNAPAIQSLRIGRIDEAYLHRVEEALVEATHRAAENAEQATLRHGEAPCRAGANRRRGRRNENAEAPGAREDTVRVLAIEKNSGETCALIHYAVHAVSLGSGDLRLSADLVGEARRRLQDALGSDLSFVSYLQGCCGNINPRNVVTGTSRGEEACMSAGRELTEAAAKALRQAGEISSDGFLDAAEEKVALPLEGPPPPAEAEKLLAEAQASLASGRNEGVNEFRMTILEGRVEYARQLLSAAKEAPAKLRSHDLTVQVLRIGGLILVALSAEVFFQYSANARALRSGILGDGPTWTLGYANGCFGYLSTADEIAKGGYEVTSAHQWYDLLPLRAECEQRTLETIQRVLRIFRRGGK